MTTLMLIKRIDIKPMTQRLIQSTGAKTATDAKYVEVKSVRFAELDRNEETMQKRNEQVRDNFNHPALVFCGLGHSYGVGLVVVFN